MLSLRGFAFSAARGTAVLPPMQLPSILASHTLVDPHQLFTGRHRSNRSRRGLYDGKDIRTGNRVSFSMKTTKRKFKPNVFTKRVYSEVLDEMVRFHLTTSALRSIDKAGGLDNYLLTSKHIIEGEGLAAKKRILREIKRREREGEAMMDVAENESTSA